MGHSVSESGIRKFQTRTKSEHFKAETLSENKNNQSQINCPGSHKKFSVLPQRDPS